MQYARGVRETITALAVWEGILQTTMDDQAENPAIEVPPSGGRYTVGVVRVGDTVRRPAQPSSPFVQGLLMYLERAGCECAARQGVKISDVREIS